MSKTELTLCWLEDVIKRTYMEQKFQFARDANILHTLLVWKVREDVWSVYAKNN